MVQALLLSSGLAQFGIHKSRGRATLMPAVKSKVVKDTKVARRIDGAALQEVLRKARMEAKVVRAVEAADRINRLQSVLDLLGHDSPDAEHLKASLKKVQEQSRVRPMGERLDSCLQPGSSKPRKTSGWQNLNWPRLSKILRG